MNRSQQKKAVSFLLAVVTVSAIGFFLQNYARPGGFRTVASTQLMMSLGHETDPNAKRTFISDTLQCDDNGFSTKIEMHNDVATLTRLNCQNVNLAVNPNEILFHPQLSNVMVFQRKLLHNPDAPDTYEWLCEGSEGIIEPDRQVIDILVSTKNKHNVRKAEVFSWRNGYFHYSDVFSLDANGQAIDLSEGQSCALVIQQNDSYAHLTAKLNMHTETGVKEAIWDLSNLNCYSR